ncbi:MAG: ROK family protein, partial [Kiritimatiellales bacterium]
LGHVPVMNPSPGDEKRQCSCGQSNCLETFLSDHGLLDFAGKQFGIEADDLSSLFAAATETQMDAFYRHLHPYLLQAGITAANLFDPATLIIGGELLEPWIGRLESEFLPELQQTTWQGSPARLKCYPMSSCTIRRICGFTPLVQSLVTPSS